jgi:hypothetical protein
VDEVKNINQSDLVTREDFRKFCQEFHLEMKSFERRMTNKVGAIVVGTASV